jgi:membrane-bound ClpP family serine protease
MEWFTVITLVALGIFLLVIELIFVPGTTFVGVIGFLLAVGGIWTAYAQLGTDTGHVVLGLTVAVSAVVVFYSFQRESWSKFALKDTNDSRVNQKPELLTEGQTGTAVSALRPSGTANFEEGHYEVHTRGEYLSAGTPIRIIRIINNKIIVEKNLI